MVVCPRCGNSDRTKIQSRKPRFQCRVCGKFFKEDAHLKNSQSSLKENSDGTGEYTTVSNNKIHTLEELIEVCQIDLEYWDIERWICNQWQMGSKDFFGHVHVQPLFQIKVWLRKKSNEIKSKNAIEEMIKEAKNFAPRYPKLTYSKSKDGMLYEITIPDIHFGRLTWENESGENYDIKIATKAVNDVLDDLLSQAHNYSINKIVLVLGNDFYNVDNRQETTAHGTPQQEDTRWQKTFTLGRKLCVQMIDKCSQVAPVDVLIVPGNHDEERSFYLGDALECWYHQNPNVAVDNAARKRKYYRYGKVLLGFTHGYFEKLNSLPMIMATEVPTLWAQTEFREFHTGDKHHRKDITNEDSNVVVRILSSLAAHDAWTFDKGYVGALKAAEAFLWHPEKGLRAQFVSVPSKYQ